MQDSLPHRGKYPVQSVARAFAILDAFDVDESELRLSTVARRTGLATSTVHRLAQVLVELGCLHQVEGAAGRYGLGSHLIALGDRALLNMPTYRLALPVMEDLAEATGLVTFLGIPQGHHALFIARVGPRTSGWTPLPLGARLHMCTGGAPMAILAFSEEAFIDEVLVGDLSSLTSFSERDPQRIRERLEEIRHRGYAASWGDVRPDAGAIGAPILNAHGRAIAAISIGAAMREWDEAKRQEVIRLLCAETDALSRRLGMFQVPRNETWISATRTASEEEVGVAE